MPTPETEIIVEDPTAPADDSPSVVSTRTVEIVVSLMLLALAVLLGYDNWRTGIAWASGQTAGRLLPVLSRPHPRRRQPVRLVTAGDRRRRRADIRHPCAAQPGGCSSHAVVLLAHAMARAHVASFLLIAELHACRRTHCAVEIAPPPSCSPPSCSSLSTSRSVIMPKDRWKRPSATRAPRGLQIRIRT